MRPLVPAIAMFLAGTTSAAEPDYASVLAGIARDISALKREYPQLAGFSVDEHPRTAGLEITYGFHTHRSAGGGGWTAGVPNPDADGVWFYIDLHDPASTLQIHTQPADPVPSCIGGKRVSFLILEGTATRKVGGPIGAILQRHGMKPCGGG
ncbi:MAG TPA: hypothetical protein VNH12_11420 [Burkholderiales bacterium]|jgi:hypothetical protein|nr:hypothetical protein [Burkholderiales bacterium]